MNVKLAKTLVGARAVAVGRPVFAQSSVTLYGLLDEGINYVNNVQTAQSGAPHGRTGAPLYQMSTGLMQPSRWGMRGTADLGNHYQALFVLEDGFDVGTANFQQGGTCFV